MRSRARFAVLLTTAAIAFAACTGGSSTPAPTTAPASAGAPSSAAPSTAGGGAPVTVDWWHITTGDPGKKDFQAIADAYHAAHPNVAINITVLENEAFTTTLSTTAQADSPDLFQ